MLEPGSEVGRYRIESLLGRGGMGVVYRAFDRALGRPIALKVVLGTAGAEDIARLVREARAAAAFAHPNSVVVHDVGEIDGLAFVAMELIDGRSLRSFVGDAALPIAQRIAWLTQIARALGAAHKLGIVHRDIKPENVIVRDDDAVAKVLDFGIARTVKSSVADASAPTENVNLGTITGANVMIGTPMYMAPEQLRGEDVDGRADQFAWGVMAYELLSGRYPWPVDNLIQLAATIASVAPRPLRDDEHPDIEPHVEQAVLRALCPDRGRRFATMEDLARTISPQPSGAKGATLPPASTTTPAAYAETAPNEAHGPAAATAPSPSPLRRNATWLVPVLGAAALATVGVLVLGAPPQGETAPLPVSVPIASAQPPPVTSFGVLDAPMPTTSPDALRAYRSALAAMRQASWSEAMPHLDKAIALDPELGAAHLRRAVLQLPIAGGDDARRSYREATRRADGMQPRDRALLEAMAPAFEDPPLELKTGTRLIDAAQAAPGDAELGILAAAFALRRSDFALSLQLAERALAVDPGYADAWQTKALAHAASGEWDQADGALERCVRVASSSIDCRQERANLFAIRGRCAEAEVEVRQVLAAKPGLRNATALLADSRFMTGDEDASIINVIRAGTEGLPPDAIRFQHARLEAGLAVLRGRFEEAADVAARGAPPELRDRDVQDSLALTRVLALRESGKEREASAFARKYLAVAGAMAAPNFDVSPVLRATAGLEAPPAAFGASPLPHLSWALWAWPYARDPASAERLLDDHPTGRRRNTLIQSGALYALEARVLGLAGHPQEVRPLLELAARTCYVLEEPFASTWANLWLGELHEAAGETTAACKAYGVVLQRWGKAKRSVSAESASKARKRLACE